MDMRVKGNVSAPQAEVELRSSASAGTVAALLAAVIAGTLGATVALPALVPGLAQSLLGSEPKAYWYLSRGSAWVAFGLLWLSTMSGLLITTKLSRLWPGGPLAFDVHEHTSLLSFGFTLFHALILLGDRYINYTPVQLLLPFASANYRPEWVGVGQLGFYLLGLVTFTFYIRRFITHKAWRLIHFLSFALFGMVVAHGLMSGTDSPSLWAQGVYWLAGASVLFLTFYRVLNRKAA